MFVVNSRLILTGVSRGGVGGAGAPPGRHKNIKIILGEGAEFVGVTRAVCTCTLTLTHARRRVKKVQIGTVSLASPKRAHH